MIVQLQIDRLAPGHYQAQILDGSVPVFEPSIHPSIEEAIREEAGGVPTELARFIEVRFAGLSSGTMSCAELLDKAPVVAAALVRLLGELHAAGMG